MSLKTPKVFCIGMHKTGTSSMGTAMTHLGYKVMSNWGMYSSDIEGQIFYVAQECLHLFDAFEDHPWAFIYPYLDKQCPNSKFILTTRNTESWYASVLRFFDTRTTPMRRWIYGDEAGSPINNKSVYVERFERHQQEVGEYFRDRSSDLLVMDLSEGQCWEKMCAFLNTNVPSMPFPHANKSTRHQLHQELVV